MKQVRITVLRITEYPDLMAQYERPMEEPCPHAVGQSWYSDGLHRPDGLCESAWQTLSPFVHALACGAEGLYGSWMKDPRSALLSCNDGFRPVSFLLEAAEAEQPSEKR